MVNVYLTYLFGNKESRMNSKSNVLNVILKASLTSLVGFCSFSVVAENNKNWVDMSDPTAVYSNAVIGGGTEGVDFSARFGSYLSGVYKQRFTVAAKHNLDFYEFNYLLSNSVTKSGITFDSSWNKDIEADHKDYEDVNDVSIGFFAKLDFMEKRLNVYPKANVGYIWKDDVEDTTYVKFDATTRYSFNKMYWVGLTPTYTYSFDGLHLKEWTVTADAGVQLSESFGINFSANNDEELTANIEFAF